MNDITPKEAIANLNHLYGMVAPDIQRSLDVAIKALERPQGECENCDNLDKNIELYKSKVAFYESQNTRGEYDVTARELKYVVEILEALGIKRPQGKWIRFRDNPHQPEHIKCSICGQYWSIADHDKTFDFCFKCGADMRGNTNEKTN